MSAAPEPREESLTRRLARLVRGRSATPADRGAAERFVRDWSGSWAAGRATPEGAILAAYESGRAGDLERRVFVAAARSHVTETDDLHRSSVTHPGCVVVPVALLLGAAVGARGHAVLDAVLRGYEVMIRVGEALGPAHYRIFHNTATAGVFGSAAAAASLLGLDEDRWVWALGSAGTQAAGLWQFNEEGAMSKPLHAGHAAAAGLRSALLAAEGLTGAERILEGAKGLFRALCPDARPELVLEGLGGAGATPAWKLPGTSMKPYPCCRHVHPAIDAALELRTALDGARPTAVRVGTYPAALDVTDRPDPRTPHEARFSIQYAVATALLRGRPTLETFAAEALAESDVRALAGGASAEVDAELAGAYPARWGARVEVDTEQGRTYRAVRAQATGDPDLPLDDPALDAKVEDLFRSGGYDAPAARAMLAATRGLLEDGPPPALP